MIQVMIILIRFNQTGSQVCLSLIHEKSADNDQSDL